MIIRLIDNIKKKKIVGINLTKKVQDLYTKNYNTILKRNEKRSKEMER